MSKNEMRRRIAELERENEILRADAEAWRKMALAIHVPAEKPTEPAIWPEPLQSPPYFGRYDGTVAPPWLWPHMSTASAPSWVASE